MNHRSWNPNKMGASVNIRSKSILGPRSWTIIATLSMGFCGNAQSQQAFGFSTLQSDTSSSVHATCNGLAGLSSRTTLQEDLFQTCRSMVQNENQLTNNGSTEFSRNLTSAELGSGYQNVATEEMLSPLRIGINSTSGQLTTVATRIALLRGGNTGLASNGFNNPNSYASIKGFRLGGGAAGDPDQPAAGLLSAFFNTFGGVGDTAQTTTENASDFYSAGFTAGLDYRVLDNFILGLAAGYSHIGLDFANNANVSGGNVDADTYGVTLYSTYYLDGFYVDGMFNYGWANYDIDRDIRIGSNNPNVPVISRTAKSSPDGSQYTLSFQSGYNFQSGALSFGPFGRFNYMEVVTDHYRETGAGGLNLSVSEQTAVSLQSIFGGQISYALSESFGVLVPFLRFDWHHEFKNQSGPLKARYISDPARITLVAFSSSPDNDYFALNTGISGAFGNGLQAFFNYNTILGHDLISSHLFTLGARMSF